MTWTIRPRSEGPGGLHYWSEGKGPALVLIHGVGLRAEAWGAMVPLMASNCTVFAVDMPGHGASPLDDTKTLPDYTDRFAAFVDALNGPVAVAGHSMGALIALDLAASRPACVASVAALNAVFERSPDAAKAVQDRASALKTFGRPDPAPTLARWFGTRPTGARQTTAKACHQWLLEADQAGYAQAYGVFARHDGPSRMALSRMQTPALFLTGAADPNSTPAMSHSMAALAPNGQAHVLEGAAHMAPMTHPDVISGKLVHHVAGAVG